MTIKSYACSKIQINFINPIQYPIFDSRIKNYFKTNNLSESVWKPTYQSKTKDIQQYKFYRDICLTITNDSRFESIYKQAVKKLGLDRQLTPLRVLESLLFAFGKEESSLIKS